MFSKWFRKVKIFDVYILKNVDCIVIIYYKYMFLRMYHVPSFYMQFSL